jgi:hypothetical protein
LPSVIGLIGSGRLTITRHLAGARRAASPSCRCRESMARSKAAGRHRRAVVPFHMDAAREGIGHHWPGRHLLSYRLTSRRETPDNPAFRFHPFMITAICSIAVDSQLTDLGLSVTQTSPQLRAVRVIMPTLPDDHLWSGKPSVGNKICSSTAWRWRARLPTRRSAVLLVGA